MFDECGTAMAMAGTADSVKALADQVTSTLDDDGIRNAFLRNVLI